MRRSWIVAIVVAGLLPASPQGAQALQRLIDVRQIATDTLRDVAVAAFVQGRPTIYYNPVLLQGFGPRMAEFFFAHEYGHLRYGHAGGALTHEDGEVSSLRQRQELDADCYAARVLAEQDREAVETALRFFRRMGPYRYDAFHPTGAQRAAKILSCLPPDPEESAEPVVERPMPRCGRRELHPPVARGQLRRVRRRGPDLDRRRRGGDRLQHPAAGQHRGAGSSGGHPSLSGLGQALRLRRHAPAQPQRRRER